MPLTDSTIRQAKPKEKPYKLSDGGGLFLLVQPGGGKWWRYKYRYAGKEKMLALGTYPDISLADARGRHAQARRLLADGNDPGEIKREAKRQLVLNAESSFEAIAREWHEKRKPEWKLGSAKTVLNRLENDILPKLGNRPVAEITAPEVLSMLRHIEGRGALDMAKRAMQTCGQVFMYAIATGRAVRKRARHTECAYSSASQWQRLFCLS
jgi:hypothetical protein